MMAETNDIKYLRTTRKCLRTKISKSCSAIEGNIDNITTTDADEYLFELSELKAKLVKLDDEIKKLLLNVELSEQQIEQEYNSCEEYSSKINKIIRRLEKIVSNNTVHARQNRVNSSGDSGSGGNPLNNILFASNNLKLPNVPLPVFSNAGDESLDRFFTAFDAVVSKFNISSYETFLLLKSQLRGEPLTLIKSLELSNESYEAARDLLSKAFSSSVDQQFNCIEKLRSLKLRHHSDSFQFISDMRLLIESFANLKIDVNVVLQYFIWSAMPEKLQNVFINITNNSKPDLKDIEKNIFDAVNRYRSSESTVNYNKPSFYDSKAKTSTMTASVKVKGASDVNFIPCILC